MCGFGAKKDIAMNIEDFRQFNEKFPAVLFPAFRVQDSMRSKVSLTTVFTFFSECFT